MNITRKELKAIEGLFVLDYIADNKTISEESQLVLSNFCDMLSAVSKITITDENTIFIDKVKQAINIMALDKR